ncbi:hypothetical protein [Nakamurella sp.]|uniref:hypothetical protein n=1 Tax=Nakamurella sp. TaxID=1869182 RepID=UPI003B3A48EC
MSARSRSVATMLRQEAAANGWSPVKFRKAAQIRRKVMIGHKAVAIPELERGARLLGLSPWDLIIGAVEAADSAGAVHLRRPRRDG